ncbi:MAG: hypothetical protein CMO80_10485 [Verrucomicrobiales bacterium]|nr:hypothetical protein [Verrucomicrobiales bacterium]|tara:strand:- start:188 stop:514 length:327 start_codon:yes stop_codon:yes gene_type:complete
MGYDHREFEPQTNPNNRFGSKEDQLEGRIPVRVTTRMRAMADVSWTHRINRGAGALQFDLYTVRLEIIYQHAPRFESSLLYQYGDRDSSRVLDSYQENLVSYPLTMPF